MNTKSAAAVDVDDALPEFGESEESDESGEMRRKNPAAIARWAEFFDSAPPEWQEVYAECDRRDPKMR